MSSSTISGIDAVQTLVQSEVDYAGEFLRMLDEYHGRPEKFDDKLMAEYHRMMAEGYEDKSFPNFGGLPYFSPSSANSCPRELYVKVRKDKLDQWRVQPHEGRSVRHGTAIGDGLQLELLFIEKHYEDMVGETPPFTFKR